MADTQQSGIQAIDKTSVHRICSGQVVLNLATAIKELVENSIDAGASNVEIRLKDYGKDLVEVVDNGKGVKEENFVGLTLKHHTSKLKDFSDLVNVDTFGFRGEALSSLCALSKLSIVTCHETANIGTKLEYDHQGRIMKQIPFPRQKGTTVSLQNLFYTLPVRHKEFIRNLKREFTKAIQVLNAYCIISTGVKITCTNQIGKGKKAVVVSTGGNPTVIENITNIFGAKQAQSLLSFVQSSPKDEICTEFGITEQQQKKELFDISGYVSSSEHGLGRSATDRQFYYINKRPCDPQKISRLVNDVYHMYNRHQYPFVVLNISLANDSVDVNVTPDKRQIFVQEEKLLLALLKSSLIKMFEPRSALYNVNNACTDKKSGELSAWNSSPDKSQTSRQQFENLKSSGSLMGNLKRRFSSVYAKTTEKPKDNLEPKQRKLDSFLRTQPTSDDSAMNKLELSDCSVSKSCTEAESICETAQVNSSDTDLFSTSSYIIHSEKHQTVHDGISVVSQGIVGEDSERLHTEDSVDMVHTSTEQSSDILQNSNSSAMGKSVHNKFVQEKDAVGKSPDISEKLTKLGTFSDGTKVQSPASWLRKTSSSQSPLPVRKSLQCFIRKQMPVVDISKSAATTELPDFKEEQTSGMHQENICEADSVENISVDSVRDADSAENIETDQTFTATFTHYDKPEELNRKERIIDFSMDKLEQSLQNRKSTSEEARRSRSFRAQIKPTENQAAEDELKKEISKDMFSKMEILGQFNLGFIVTRLGRDLFIIDQHATDEKYNFEQLQKHTVIQSQKLIHPQKLELTASNECILIDNLEIFHANGFDFVIDEDAPPTQRVCLTSMPISKNWTFGKEDIEEMIFMLTDSPGVMCRPSRIRQMFASRACRKSIMIGTALNKSEMKKLVCRMGELDQPWNCPHGRPTMRHLINLDLLPD